MVVIEYTCNNFLHLNKMSGNNVIIGANAVLPVGATQNTIVLGSAASTVYLAGGAMRASATALTLTTPLIAGGSAGTSGQILKSTGGGIEWAAASTAPAAALSFTSDTAVTPANSVYVLTGTSAATLSLPAVNTLVGVPLMTKNQSTGVLTVSGAALVAPGSTAVIATAPIASGGSCQIVSDGTNWLMIDAAGAPPATPGTPTSVAITQPAGGATPSTLTVTYTVPANATSFLVQIAQIIDGSPVYVGSASAAVSSSPMSVAVPATVGAYNTTSTNLFMAFVTPFNGWAPGTTGNSVPYNYGLPTGVAIATPTGTDAVVNLNVTWTAPAFAPDSYKVEILVGGVVQGTVYPSGGATAATVTNIAVNTSAAISARVTAYKDAVGYVGADSPGYYWTTPSSLTATRSDTGTNLVQISGNWTLPAYGVSNYATVRVDLYQKLTDDTGLQIVATQTLASNIISYTSTNQPSYIPDDQAYVYYYILTYLPTWGGYSATAQSPTV